MHATFFDEPSLTHEPIPLHLMHATFLTHEPIPLHLMHATFFDEPSLTHEPIPLHVVSCILCMTVEYDECFLLSSVPISMPILNISHHKKLNHKL
jgi:hypothetical protein